MQLSSRRHYGVVICVYELEYKTKINCHKSKHSIIF